MAVSETMVGIILTIVASLFSSSGKVLIKLSKKQAGSSWAMYLGWGFNCALAPILDTSAFAFADQGVLAPLCSLSILWNIVFSRLLLKEAVTIWGYVGTIAIAGGVVGTVMSGNTDDRHYSAYQLGIMFKSGRFQMYALFMLFLLFELSLVHVKVRRKADVPVHTQKEIVVICCLAGLIAGNLYLLKSFTEVARQILSESTASTVHPLLLTATALVVCSILVGMMAVMQLNEALSMNNVGACVVNPLYEGTLILTGVVSGASFFDEWSTYKPWQIGCFLASLTVVLLGIWCIIPRQEILSKPIRFPTKSDILYEGVKLFDQ